MYVCLHYLFKVIRYKTLLYFGSFHPSIFSGGTKARDETHFYPLFHISSIVMGIVIIVIRITLRTSTDTNLS